MIDVRRIAEGNPAEFEVTVREGAGQTRHHVAMAEIDYRRIAAGRHTREQCIDAAFRFLLDREPKESILSRFEFTAIARYFPDFERALPAYLRPRAR